MAGLPWVLALLGSCGAHRAETAALSEPSDPERWEHLGDVRWRRLQRAKAADAYRMALQLDPQRSALQARISGRKSSEARELERRASRSPTDDEMWGDLGDLLRTEGDVIGARAAFLRAFRIDPVDGEWQRALAELGEGEMVLQILLGRIDPDDDESVGDYGDVLSNVGQAEEACRYWRQAAELDPSDEEWLSHASDCGFPTPDGYHPPGADTGVEGGAEPGGDTGAGTGAGPDDIESLVSRVRADAGLLVRLGQAYVRAGNLTEATETLWGALLVAHTDEEALQSYLVASGKTRREALEALRAVFPEDDEVVGLLADHYLDLGLRDRARELYEAARALDPDDPEWRAKHALLTRAQR